MSSEKAANKLQIRTDLYLPSDKPSYAGKHKLVFPFYPATTRAEFRSNTSHVQPESSVSLNSHPILRKNEYKMKFKGLTINHLGEGCKMEKKSFKGSSKKIRSRGI